MIGQHHRRLAGLDGLFCECDALGNAVHLGRRQKRFPLPPRRLRHVAADLCGECGISIGQHLHRHADIGHVGKRKAEEDIDIDVRLARFPHQRPLDQVHPGRRASPLQHGRRDDRDFFRHMRRLVVAPDRPHQGSRRALALQIAVIMRKIFHRERHVGVFEELVVLIAMKIEGRGDERFGANRFAHPPRQFGLGAGDAAHCHGAVQAKINAVERFFRFDLGDHRRPLA